MLLEIERFRTELDFNHLQSRLSLYCGTCKLPYPLFFILPKVAPGFAVLVIDVEVPSKRSEVWSEQHIGIGN
jgi:hypothetical protein